MPKAKLSEKVIAEIAYLPNGNSFQVYWSDDLPGFGVRVYQSGAKSYVVKYRIQGKQFVDTLGPAELISLDQARESARRTLIRAYNERMQPSASDRLISEFCSEYIERYARDNVPDWTEEENLCNLYIKSTWGDRPISSLRKSDVVAMVGTVSGISSELANRIKALISRMWELAMYWNYIDEALKNPTECVPDIEILNCDLSTADMPERLFAALETERNYFARAAILVLLFSGLHKSECIEAKWSDIDWEAKAITVQRIGNKRKRPFVMPVSEPAFAILQSLPKHPTNPFIFCGKERGLPIDDFDERWERVRALAGITQTNLRELRHSVASTTSSDGGAVRRAMKVLGYSAAQNMR